MTATGTFTPLSYLKRGIRRNVVVPLKPCFEHIVHVKPAKVKDLHALLQYVPEHVRSCRFYETVTAGGGDSDYSDVDEVE